MNNKLDKLIGVPYVKGGSDYKGVDCYGLIKLYYNDMLNIQLPDHEYTDDNLERFNQILAEHKKHGFSLHFLYLEENLKNDDIVLIGTKKGNDDLHFGVYHDGYILHAFNTKGVVATKAKHLLNSISFFLRLN